MVFDHEQQRKFLLEMMQNMNYPGTALEFAFHFKQEVLNAYILPPLKQSEAIKKAQELGMTLPEYLASASD